MNNKKQPSGLAIVTGAAGGMGSAAVRLLAKAGHQQMVLCDVSKERLSAVAVPLREAGITVDILAGDLSEPGFPAQLIAALQGRKIQTLIHTAGISPRMASAERVMQVNLDATARLVEAVLPHMAEGSAAVLVASNSAYIPISPEADAAFSKPLPPEGTAALMHLVPSQIAAYPLSKRGVITLVKQHAIAFGERGARLVSVSPGATDTDMVRSEMKETDGARQIVERAAIKRMAQPEELAAVMVFLASPAASFVTACDVLVDGGELVGMGL